MLSGNGRHRRPRQAPALLVAAGVTGSAIAIPLLGATGASAADGSVWDKVADCETGGSWSADKGNGKYGGLSLTQEDWEAYGGLDYATRPDQASRNQQIAVARNVLAAQGVDAWGSCGATAGLTEENGSVEVDTGVAEDSSASSGLSDNSKGSSDSSNSSGKPSNSSDASGSSGSSGSSDSADPSTPTDAASPSSPSSSSSATADNSGKSDASKSDDSDVSDSQPTDNSPTIAPDADKSDQSRGSWSLVDTGSITSTGTGRHRGVPAEESAGVGARTTASDTSYTVHTGDTLVSIADSLDIGGGWHALYDLNKDVIGADPGRIVPGQTLSVVAG